MHKRNEKTASLWMSSQSTKVVMGGKAERGSEVRLVLLRRQLVGCRLPGFEAGMQSLSFSGSF